MSHESDLQNKAIMEQLAKAQLAVNQLHALGLSVLSINKIGERPCIQIIPGHGCNQLESVWTRRLVVNGHRSVERVALLSGCQVSWEGRS